MKTYSNIIQVNKKRFTIFVDTNRITHVIFSSGPSLEADQIRSICTGTGGSTASDQQISEYLIDEGWDNNEIGEFIDFIHSSLCEEMFK